MTAITSQQTVDTEEQYSLAKILGIWLAVALPMFLLGWIVFPAAAPDFEINPIGRGAARMAVLTVGLVWEFALVLLIVFREEGNLRWSTLKRRLRLNPMLNPKTGEPRRRLWLWLIPLILLHLVASLLLLPMIDQLVTAFIPLFSPPVGSELIEFLQSPETMALLVGAQWMFGLFLFMAFFNIFGEELFWRGVLLPKMNGVFGKWDWIANGALGGLYHMHMPWSWFGTTGISWIFFYALPAKYFRSTWVSIISHGSMIVMESVIFLFFIMGLA